MKLFKNESEARHSLNEKEMVYTNGLCPYSNVGRLCGSWCALFYFDEGDGKRTPYIILGCKTGTDKKLYV
jgi:hypothetical protein